MKFRKERRQIKDLDMTPLIDVIFQLLIFFLVTTTFVSNPGMSIERPKAKNSGQLDQKGWTIEIPYGGGASVVFNGTKMDYETLQAKLAPLYQKEPNAQINIDADENVEHKVVVKIMDIVSGVGFSKIGIVTSPQADKK